MAEAAAAAGAIEAAALHALPRITLDTPVWRLVASRLPTVSLFDVARDAEELALLAELEGLTNPRRREELGQITLVGADEGLYGPGCTPIMAAFCHPAPSRFSDGRFGLYYAAVELDTAIAETRHHRERFLRDSRIGPEALEMRSYRTEVLQPMTEVPDGHGLLDPDDYSASRRFGTHARAAKLWGLTWPSVRDSARGRCIGALRPKALGPATQGMHYRYHWNGQRIDSVEEYRLRALR